MLITNSQKLPIKLWMKENSDLESGAWDQVKNLANYPFAFHHIAIMPDSHQGYGMPIGGVMATKDVVVPNAVGVDIGCGMYSVRTNLEDISQVDLKKIMNKIRERIPVGFNRHEKNQGMHYMPDIPILSHGIVIEQLQNALYQVGTLGGGNHFIEIQKGSDNHIWVMIHSGSRNLGKTVADHYNKVAIELNEKENSKVPPNWDLAYLPVESQEGKDYIDEMTYCIGFASMNRKLMMDRVLISIAEVIPNMVDIEFRGNPFINIPHNYAYLEKHFGEKVWVHRKGATLATKDTIGIIPGSQGTSSFIVMGKGNPESFNSCSHGSGRLMSRSAARKNLKVEDEVKHLDKIGVIHSIRSTKDLDEAPSAYKDIMTVMDNQKDLVETLVGLNPLAVIKG